MNVNDLENGDVIEFADNIFEVVSIKKNNNCLDGFLIYHKRENDCFKYPLLAYEKDLETGFLKIIKLGGL